MLKRGIRKQPQSPTTDNPFWPDTKRMIETGAVTPIIGNFVSFNIFGGDPGLVAESWAADVESPFSARENRELARVAQYYSVENSNLAAKRHYLDALKNYLFGLAQDDRDVDSDFLEEQIEDYQEHSFSHIAYQLGYPKYPDEEQNILRLLAELPLPIYITTGYHDFLEVALTRVPKDPVSEIFYWHDSLLRIPSIFDDEPGYVPSVERPLVYHLYGLDEYPESLVLSEDDYLDFLIKLSQMTAEVQYSEHRRKQPSSVRLALAGTSLLLLGYGVYDWEFRALFKGLIQDSNVSRNSQNKPESISVQVSPEDGESQEQIKTYLKKYFDKSSFRVYWGKPHECVQALWRLWQE